MSKSTALFVKGRSSDVLVERAIAAAGEGPPEDRVRAGLAVAIEFAESDPEAARAALWKLRGDHDILTRLEACLGASERATMALGAALQLADAELASPTPDLRRRLPELVRWLENDW